MSRPMRIVITGGPCAGKSSVHAAIKRDLGDLFEYVPECATMLLSGGYPSPPPMADELNHGIWMRHFQSALLHTIDAVESLAVENAMRNNHKIVLCDRGVADAIAYYPDGEQAFYVQFGISKAAIFSRYKHVLFLDSLAVTKPELFGKAGNAHRFELLDEALITNRRTREAWEQHPGFVHVPPFDTLEQKVTWVRTCLLSKWRQL